LEIRAGGEAKEKGEGEISNAKAGCPKVAQFFLKSPARGQIWGTGKSAYLFNP
jgi:hypothetical protein